VGDVEGAALEVRDPSGGRHASRGGRPLSPRRLLLLVFLFFALSIPLAWLWREWGVLRYVAFLLEILRALHDAMGWPFTGKGAGGLSLHFLSHVSFLVLVLLTPGLSGRRRLMGALVGSAVITAMHLFMITLANAAFLVGRGAVFKVFPFILVMDGLPLIIWVVVARDFLRTLVPGLGEEPRTSEIPD
jgi:hypothetical protein